jgi:drug/metabolite transporter (DMT)-like permease
MSEQPKALNSTVWGLLILFSVLCGTAFFFTGIAVKELPPLTVVLARVLLAAMLLLPVFWFYGHKLPKTPSQWKPYFIMGLLNNVVPFSFIFAAQTMITVGLASIINAMTPLFAIIIMASFGEEILTGNRVIGVIIGIVGVGVLQGFNVTLDSLTTLGVGLGLVATLSYGFAALWGRRYLSHVPPLKSATCQLICSSAVMLVVVGIVDEPWALQNPSLNVWMSLIGLALLGTAISYTLFFHIMVRYGASNVMLGSLLIPVSAILLGNAFLGEEILTKEIAGAIIIGLGLLFIDGRLFRRRRA